MPLGTMIHNIEMQPARVENCKKRRRIIGTFKQGRTYAVLKMPSGELKSIDQLLRNGGVVSNSDHNLEQPAKQV